MKPSSDATGIHETQPQELDWTRLEGRTVQVCDHGHLIDHGRVDAVTSDGSIMWLAQNGVRTRWLVEKLPGRSIAVLTEL